MKRLNILFVILLISLTFSSVAQNYNMTDNTTINDCGGTFFDSGGNGNYTNGENLEFTICPDVPGSFATVDFTLFDIEDSFDFLTIYDGNNTGAPSLGTYTGTTGPGFVSATTGNASGCLTFVFTSDFSVTDIGWIGQIGCTQPCQDVIANANFSPAPDGDGVIRLCQGETLTMNGNGVYPDNNTGYTQSDGTSTFQWSTQDGADPVGQNVTHTYNDAGAYFVQLEITDIEGCSNSNDIDQEIRVSTTPIFAGTAGAPDPICLGEQAVFTGVVTPVEYEQNCTQPNFPDIALPDGSGVSYETSTNIDCYGSGQGLTDINDLLSICVNMEHSYIGDLNIEIECPSGQTVTLLSYVGNTLGGAYLGIPVDNDAQPNNQGTGFQYCWEPGAGTGTWNANDPGFGNSLPAGSYDSDNPLSDLVGCDLNGDWTLIITDNLASDNGFIFDWSINFDPGILPPPITFTPTIVSDGWQADPTIVGGTNPITVEPTSVGNACYTYEVTDNFNCTYDTTVCITVNPSPIVDPIADITDCNPVTLPNITGTDLTGNQAFYTGPNGTGTQYNPGDVIGTTTTLYIYDEQAVAPFCSDEETFTITITNPVLTINCPGALTATCDISEQPSYGSFADFQTAGGSASTTAGANILPGTFTLVSEISDGNTCPEVVTRTYQIEDDCGNIETCTQTITINDNIDPTATAPADASYDCIGDVPAANAGDITDEADNCSVPNVVYNGETQAGTCPMTITRTWDISDACGNTITVTQLITVDDNIDPTATAPADASYDCIGDVPVANAGDITDAADNCTAAPTVVYNGESTAGTCPMTITRTWDVSDDCGNTITVTQLITVDDNIDPTATAPADASYDCIGDVPVANAGDITDAADNCTAAPTVVYNGETTAGTCPQTITRTWDISDDCGNTITVTQLITVDDNIDPTATAPADASYDCIGDVPVANAGDITDAADNCTAAPTVVYNGETTAGTCPQTITRTWDISDDCGNTITVTQLITVDDNIDPTATAPADASYDCIGDVPVANAGDITDAADNCTAAPTVVYNGETTAGTCPQTITRTWDISDDCGNTITVTQLITVDDNIDPTATAPADASYDCIGDVPVANAGDITDAADNCTAAPTVVYNGETTAGTCPMTITRTWDVSDDCGNTITVTQLITVDDNIAPAATAPAAVAVQCIGDVPAPNTADVTGVSDNCTAVPTVTHVGDVSDGNTCPEVITRTYEITDDCGNTTTVTQTITVNDTQDPTASNPAPISATGSAPAPDVTVVDDEADNCTVNPVVAFVGDVTDGLNCPETITRTYSVTDECGNQILVEQTITIGDAIIPTASNPAPIAVQCIGDVPAPDETVVDDEADNGAVPTVTWEDDTSDGNTCPEIITRRYRVTDDCGNFIFVEQTITVDDDIDPTATAPAPIAVQCAGDVPAANIADITDAADNCAAPTVTHVGDVSDGNTCPEVITRTYRIEDACGNFIEVDQIITINDDIAPAATAPLAAAVQCIGDVPAPNTADVTGVSDNCTALPTVTHVGDASDGNTCPEVITRTYEIEDDCGNITTVTQTITVNDDIDPTGTAPADLTVQCIGDVPAVNIADVTGVSDNCAAPTVTHVGDVNSGGACPIDITRTYRIEDACGNFIEVDQVITVDDNIAPTGTAPADLTVQCIGDVPAADPTLINDEADNCSVPTVTHVGDVSDGNTCPEVITRTYRIEDACGNFIEVDQTITIDDDIDPTGTAPAPVAVQCIGDVPAANIADITDAADNCAAPTVTHVGDVSDGNTCPEVITRTYRIEDACGNFIEVDQIITVDDDIAPTASNPAAVVVECDTDVPAPDVTVVTDAADNCSVPTVTHVGDVSDGNVCNGEVITRTYRVEDECGNFIEVTQTITIDSYTPTFTVAGTDPTVCGGTDGFITISGLDPNTDYTFEFNGGASSTITTDAAGEYVITGLGSGSYTGFTVSDVDCPACSTTDGVTITLTDPNPPAVDAGVDQEVCAGSAVTLTAVNPDGANITWDNGVTDGTPFNPGVGTVTYTVTADLAGCINSDVVEVTVVPTIDALSCPGQLTAVCDITEQPAYADFDAFIAAGGSATIDPAGEIDSTSFVMISEISDGNTCPETITRTYQIADTCGVTVTCTQDIVIHDLVDPTASNPAPIAVQCIGDVPAFDITVVTDAADNCSVPTVTHVGDVSDGNTCPEVITRTYRVEDACGNFIEVDQTITINDDIDPTGTAPAPVAVQCIGDVPAANIADITDAADNCAAPTVTHVGDVSDGNTCPEVITRTYRIEDACGNFIEVDQIITVDDDIAPTASNPAAVVVECDTDVPAPDVTVVTDAADNCSVPTVTHVGDVSDGNVCNGEVITRTYRVEDECGNFIEVTQTITIDSYTPTFAVAGTDPTVCGGTDGFITISGLDPNTDYTFEFNGGASSTITTDAAGEYVITGLGSGSYTGFTVSDVDCPACSTTDGVTITLTDPNPPAVDAGVDQEVCAGSAVTLTAGNPDGANITWDNGVTDGTPFNPGVGTVTYTVTADLAGCINSDAVQVTVVPTIDALSCPGQLTAVCDITEQPAYADFDAFIAAGGSATIDPAGEIDSTSFVMISEVSDGNTCPETVTRTYQIADTCGVTVTCTQDIVIHDLVDPTASNPAPIAVQCIGDVPAFDITVVTDAADNCSVPTVTHVGDVSDGNTCPEVITRTYRIEDACGNFIEVDQTITIDDDIDPTGTAPAPVAVQCIGDVPAANIADITDAADNCAAPTVTHVGDVSDGNTCPEVITRTYRIEDACGNFIEVDQIITVDDDIAPTASNPAAVVVECDTDVPAPDVTVVTDAADNCSVPTVTHVGDVSDGNVCNGEVITRTYRVEDECGNFIEVTQTITIDSYTPTFAVAGTDPTVCGGTDGFITISGLDPNTDYTFEFNGGASSTITTDAAGEYVITGLGSGSYTGFTVSDVDCPACSTTDGVTITLTDPNPPVVDAGADQQVCAGTAVTLTAVNPDGANITWDNGVTDGTPFNPGVGTVTYTVTADLANCISTDEVDVTVYAVPAIDPLADQEECDSYTLPAITGTDLTGNEAYYDATNGGGTQYNPGDVINTAGTTTLFIYDETGTTPNCFDEQTFDVTINLTPVVDPLADQEECDSYTLPAITGTNLTGNEAYYDAPNGGGTQYNAGDAFTIAGTTTLYIYDETGTTPNCFNEQSFDVTINLTPVIDPLADQEACDSYTLPAITGTNLTGNEAYYDAPNGGGTQYNAGDNITTSTTLYIYDETATTPNCFNEQTFDVTINITPVVDPLADQTECDSYTLPAITGTDLTGNEAYYDAPNGGGTQYNPGDAITAAGTTTLYIYDETGTTPNCFNEQTFDVTINITPTFALASTDPTTCLGADGTVTISGLVPNTAYDITYSDGGVPVGPNNMNSDAAGDLVIGGLTAGSYSDFVVTLNGCTATDNTAINLVDPDAPLVDAGPDQVICEGEEAILTAGNPDGANINWDNGVTDGVAFNPAVGTVTYTVTAELFNCFSTDQVDITVNPLPIVNAGNDLAICEGDQVVLTASGADSYAWDNGVVNGQPFSPAATTTYTVTGSTLGCENTDEVVVTVVENPVVVFEADETIGCVPLTVNLSSLTQGNIVNCTYTLSDGTVLNGCDVTHTFDQAGCYDVTLEVENSTGCISSTTIQNYICVDNYPIADFEFEPGVLTNIVNQANFTNTSSGATTYEWNFGDGESSSNVNPTHTFDTDPDSGEEEYEVTLVAISEYGCADTVSTVIPVIEELIFYVPNTFTPDGNAYNQTFQPVFTSGFDPQDYTLLIFNRWGEVIFESKNADIGWDGTYGAGSMEVVKDGTYVWKIEFKTKYNDERIVEVGHVNVLR